MQVKTFQKNIMGDFIIKKIVPITIITMFLVTFLQGQKLIHVDPDHSCSFDGALSKSTLYGYDADPEMIQIAERIVDIVGLRPSFEMKASNVPNASAFIQGNQKIILYSDNFMAKLLNETEVDWAAYGVLAHEIAHILNGDPLVLGGGRPEFELAADEFSGRVLKLMGATLEEAQSAVSTTKTASTSTHPPRSARMEAVFRGWNKVGSAVLDSDGDRIPDTRDLCPNEYGTPKTNGCPDADGDGVPDKEDDCKYAVGPIDNKGCPIILDKDSDGVLDVADKCPDQKGEKHFQGCPDSDGDGVPDNEDNCPDQKGLTTNWGCPKGVAKTTGPRLFSFESFEENMILVKGGSFVMGCTSSNSSDCEKNEKPAHEVVLSDFYIGKYEVTQKEWEVVMGKLPDGIHNTGCALCPVEMVSWDVVQKFIYKLNSKTGKNYRLPTEAEWEYAAKGGSESTGDMAYSGSNEASQVAWFWDNSQNSTHNVASKKPNALGIYDMTGNVWEWCLDWYGRYSASKEVNPQGPKGLSYKILRGGSWGDKENLLFVTHRESSKPETKDKYTGFRLVMSMDK